MLIALHHLERIRASPRTIAICPECKEEVVPKCGKIKVWHSGDSLEIRSLRNSGRLNCDFVLIDNILGGKQ
jgi:hypothetical protein